MQPLTLNQIQKDKLLEMCKVLFLGYQISENDDETKIIFEEVESALGKYKWISYAEFNWFGLLVLNLLNGIILK